MPAHDAYDYAVIRVMPRVERGEFINVGIVLSCEASRYLAACIEPDAARLLALDPALDLESLQRHLDAIQAVCRGGDEGGAIGRLPHRARFHWLTATRSAVIQTSPVHTGVCADLGSVMEHLMDAMVRVRGGRGTSGEE